MTKKPLSKYIKYVLVSLAAFLLLATLSGCISYLPLELPQMREFKESVLKKYPRAKVYCNYQYHGRGVDISAINVLVDEEFAYTVLGILQPIVCDEGFIQDLFELYEEEDGGEYNWERGERPDIGLYIGPYQFSARATKEGYNSGYDPDSYTWDGYTTWYGTEFVDHEPREITPEEIEETIAKYCEP